MSQTLLTGIQATGQPHLGNYIGSIQPAIKLIEELKGPSYLFIADYHALTNESAQKNLKKNIYEVAATWLACGVNPEKTILYRQSDIPEIFELYWILSCVTPKGLLNRAHSYKAHIQKNKERKKEEIDFGLSMGVFNYPLLMASDILLFQSHVVPVGKDQLQHLEMTRDIAIKFNNQFKTDILIPPKEIIRFEGSLLGIDGQKMSKSYHNHIPIFSKDFKKQVMKIKTDSLPPEAPKDTKTSIVFHLYKSFSSPEKSKKFKEKLEKGMAWGEAKEELYKLLEDHFSSKRKVYDEFISQPKKIDLLLQEGAQKARIKSKEVIKKIKQLISY